MSEPLVMSKLSWCNKYYLRFTSNSECMSRFWTKLEFFCKIFFICHFHFIKHSVSWYFELCHITLSNSVSSVPKGTGLLFSMYTIRWKYTMYDLMNENRTVTSYIIEYYWILLNTEYYWIFQITEYSNERITEYSVTASFTDSTDCQWIYLSG